MATFECHEHRVYMVAPAGDLEGFDARVEEHEELHRQELAEITTQNAQHALWVAGGDWNLGLEPGSFTTHLIRAIMHADLLNRALVAQAFPGLVRAVVWSLGTTEQIETLRTLVKDRTGVTV
jgi:hypothetical protein